MKIRFLTGVAFLISFFNMKAQEQFSVNMNLKTEPTSEIDFNETNIGVTVNTKMNAKNILSNTVEYSNLKVNYETGSFTKFEDLNKFSQLKYTIAIGHEISNNTKLNLSITPIVSFQSKIDFSDAAFLGKFEISRQFSPSASLSIGAARSTIFGEPKFTPVFALKYKMNTNTELQIGFPDSKLSYSNNSRNNFNLSNSFNGNYYNLDPIAYPENAEKMILSQMTSAFEYERNVDKNWFINFKAGYDFNKKYNLTDQDNHKVYDFNTGDGYLLGIGIKYKL